MGAKDRRLRYDYSGRIQRQAWAYAQMLAMTQCGLTGADDAGSTAHEHDTRATDGTAQDASGEGAEERQMVRNCLCR